MQKLRISPPLQQHHDIEVAIDTIVKEGNTDTQSKLSNLCKKSNSLFGSNYQENKEKYYAIFNEFNEIIPKKCVKREIDRTPESPLSKISRTNSYRYSFKYEQLSLDENDESAKNLVNTLSNSNYDKITSTQTHEILKFLDKNGDINCQFELLCLCEKSSKLVQQDFEENKSDYEKILTDFYALIPKAQDCPSLFFIQNNSNSDKILVDILAKY